MSKRSDPSQGAVKDPARPASRPTPKPNTAAAVRREVQRELDRKDAAQTRPRAPQKVTGERDWRRG
jgi:hypothetical protein